MPWRFTTLWLWHIQSTILVLPVRYFETCVWLVSAICISEGLLPRRDLRVVVKGVQCRACITTLTAGTPYFKTSNTQTHISDHKELSRWCNTMLFNSMVLHLLKTTGEKEIPTDFKVNIKLGAYLMSASLSSDHGQVSELPDQLLLWGGTVWLLV